MVKFNKFKLIITWIFIFSLPVFADYLKPFDSIPNLPKLTEEQKKKVLNGEIVYWTKIYKNPNWGEGFGVVLIKAKPKKIWSVILNYPEYPNFIKQLRKVSIYKKEKKEDKILIWARFEAKVFIMKINYHIKHIYFPDKSALIWEMDKSRENDFENSIGYWQIKPYNDNSSLVYYLAKVEPGRWIPGFLMKWLTKTSLIDILGSVKKRLENE